jgi:TDG/mug DNA glycosylase family protein
MDRRTVAIYQAQADEWIARRRPKHVEDGQLDAFARRLRRGGRVADLGCGPGWYAQHLSDRGVHVAAMDVARAMLVHVRRRAPAIPCVCGDLAALPFADRSLDGAWAANCYVHVHGDDLPLAFARLHAALRPGAPVALSLANLSQVEPTAIELRRCEAERRFKDGELPGRLFTAVTVPRARALLVGAGFERVAVAADENPFWLWIRARRARTLPDLVRPGLRLLICGLNPSLYSADAGIPFARRGNRFWAAARAAGLVVKARDSLDALRRGIGMTDLVKRASVAAGDLRREEYVAGVRRVEALVLRFQPRAVCFVGLEGWRAAADRGAQPGWIAGGFGGRPAYLMPSTSGRNARVSLAELAAHLRTAADR